MADYLMTEIHEEDGFGDAPVPPSAPPKRSRLGLVVVALATVGSIGTFLAATVPGKRVTALQRASLVTKTFMTAFSAGQVSHKGRLFTADSHFLWAEEGAAEPGNMTVEAVLQLADEEHTHPEIKFVLSASHGQGKSLTAHLQKLKAQLHELIADDSEDDAADFNRSVRISLSDTHADGVVIKVVRPPGEFGDSSAAIEESMREQAPTFRAKLALGRTIAEIMDNFGENPLLLPGGIKASFSTCLGMKLIAGLEAVRGLDNLGQSVLDPQEYNDVKMGAEALGALSYFGMNTSIRYRRDELEEMSHALHSTTKRGPLFDLVQEVHFATPPTVRVALRNMSTSVDSLQSMEFQGLPGNWELLVNFSNFSLSNLLTTIIPKDSLTKGGDDPDDDSDYDYE